MPFSLPLHQSVNAVRAGVRPGEAAHRADLRSEQVAVPESLATDQRDARAAASRASAAVWRLSASGQASERTRHLAADRLVRVVGGGEGGAGVSPASDVAPRLHALDAAGIMMAFGEEGARAIRSIFERFAVGKRGAEFFDLSTATIRAVAKGVLGVAFLQAIIVGICLLIAGIPWAGVLTVIVLVLGIAQVPALIATLPAIAYLWASGNYGTGAAILYTVLLVVSGTADNVLKPLMLGRGVDAPMPVILLGALGGMAAAGILGMFVGATLLALGYQIFMGWVATDPEPARGRA